MSSHLIGNDSGQSSLTQTRRTVKKDVIQCIMPLFGSFYIYFECSLGLFLTNEFIKSLRTEASLQRQILLILFLSAYGADCPGEIPLLVPKGKPTLPSPQLPCPPSPPASGFTPQKIPSFFKKLLTYSKVVL